MAHAWSRVLGGVARPGRPERLVAQLIGLAPRRLVVGVLSPAERRRARIHPAEGDEGRGLPLSVPVIAVLLAAVATSIAASHGWLTLYDDARSHLNIARRLTDSTTPGFGQLGSIWLPLPHLLMAPLAAIDWMWQSAAAGAIVSGVAFVYASVRVFSLVDDWFGNRFAAWTAFAVFAGNLNLLYMQSTALDEPLMLACFVGAVYHLARWTRSHALGDLLLAGIAMFLATLTRYDAWGVFLAAIIAVAIWSRLERRRPGYTQANMLVFAFIGGYGIALWFLYNFVILHDPLFFLHGQVTEIDRELQLANCSSPLTACTRGNAVDSGLIYGWAVLDVVGWPAMALAVVGALGMLARRGAAFWRNLALLMVLASPIVLNVVTLYLGQTTILVPQRPPFQVFNLRFGIEALPFAAVCIAYLATLLRRRSARLPALAAVIAASVIVSLPVPILLAEGLTGVAGYGRTEATAASAYLHPRYSGGEILVDETQTQPFIFAAGFDLRQFITVRSHGVWAQALADPAHNAKWVVAFTGDAISQDMAANPARFTNFRLVFQQAPYRIYERLP